MFLVIIMNSPIIVNINDCLNIPIPPLRTLLLKVVYLQVSLYQASEEIIHPYH